MNNFINFKTTAKAFYETLKVDFNNINQDRYQLIEKKAIIINKLYNDINFRLSKSQRYVRLMELLTTACRKESIIENNFQTKSLEEKYLLFVLGIDPTFEAIIIYLSENNKSEIKRKMFDKFKLYDSCLIKIEKMILEKLLKDNIKKQIYEEADKRSFK